MAAQDIINAYTAKLGRPPDARELESELENDAKYGHAQLLKNLDERAAPTFSGGGRGGDADTNTDGIADAGWARNPSAMAGRSWVRARELPRLSGLLGGGMPQTAPVFQLDPRRFSTMPVGRSLMDLLRY